MLETNASMFIPFRRKLPSGAALYRQSYIPLDLPFFDSARAWMHKTGVAFLLQLSCVEDALEQGLNVVG
jgi:hypothetical protein